MAGISTNKASMIAHGSKESDRPTYLPLGPITSVMSPIHQSAVCETVSTVNNNTLTSLGSGAFIAQRPLDLTANTSMPILHQNVPYHHMPHDLMNMQNMQGMQSSVDAIPFNYVPHSHQLQYAPGFVAMRPVPVRPLHHSYLRTMDDLSTPPVHLMYHCCGGTCNMFNPPPTTHTEDVAAERESKSPPRDERRKRKISELELDQEMQITTMVDEFKNKAPHYRRPPTKKGFLRVNLEERQVLENVFDITTNPPQKIAEYIAEQLNMNENQVKSWFYRRRRNAFKTHPNASVDSPLTAPTVAANEIVKQQSGDGISVGKSKFVLVVSPQGRKERGVPVARLTTVLSPPSNQLYIDDNIILNNNNNNNNHQQQ